MVAASDSAASSMHLGAEARRQAKAQAPAGRDRLGRLDPGDLARGG